MPIPADVYGLLALLNTAGLGLIAYLLVTRGIGAVAADQRETRARLDANTNAVNRMVRMWALWLVTERRDIPEGVRQEARSLLEEARADRGGGGSGAAPIG